MLTRSIWSASEDCKIHKLILISGVISPIAFVIAVTIALYIINPYILWGIVTIVLVVALWLKKKMRKTAQTVNYQIVDRVTVLMTEILTLLHADIGIKKPYDVHSVWKPPTISEDGEKLTYHAKARQSENVQLDGDSLDEYVSLINGRALDIGAPIQVTQIHPLGNTFVYDIYVTNGIFGYVSPNEAKEIEKEYSKQGKDFNNQDRDF